MMRLWAVLRQPFPESRPWKERVGSFLLVAVFVTLFLWAFQPFDLDQARGSAWFNASLFGLVTLLVSVAYDTLAMVLGVRQDVPSWTLDRWLLHTLALISLIGLGNYAVVVWMGGGEWSLSFLGQMLANTLLVAVFPIFFAGMTKATRASSRFQAMSEDLVATPKTQSHHALQIKDDRGVAACSMALDDLLYLESQQNYVIVYYRFNSQVLQCKVRHTLSGMVADIGEADLRRCHRSFAVYTRAVGHFTGNAQGLQLHLRDAAGVVPVSRSYVAEMRAVFSTV